MRMFRRKLHIIAVDCCEHILAALGNMPSSQLTSLYSRERAGLVQSKEELDLIVIGVSKYPMRRLFISQLRRIYPRAPVLILRREELRSGNGEDRIRGEFVICDQYNENDWEILHALRQILPFAPCEHTDKGHNYETVREVVKVIASHYADPDLNLAQVAKALPMSPIHLSRILNKQVGVSFRQLLRRTRIEEAKRMLASHKYSVKEVAARVGFSDSHYFSRSFKETTGFSASSYQSQDTIFN